MKRKMTPSALRSRQNQKHKHELLMKVSVIQKWKNLHKIKSSLDIRRVLVVSHVISQFCIGLNIKIYILLNISDQMNACVISVFIACELLWRNT